MTAPKDLKYTKTHEWVRVDGDVITVGLTDHAQEELGDVTYLELPDVGGEVESGEPFGVVESVKAASDIYSPITGEVLERNEDAVSTPDIVNASPYDRAWLIKVRVADTQPLADLMDPDSYDSYVETSAAH